MVMAKKQTTLSISSGIIGSSSNISIAGSLSGTSITTGTLTGTSLTGGASLYSISSSKTTYHVLGEDVQVSSGGYKDVTLVTNIATLNVLGKPFLDELHKNGTFFPSEIEEYLEKKFKWIERDKKIDDIIN